MATKSEKSYPSRHIFKVSEPKFLCEEVLYVSSSKHPSGYKIGHKANKGKRYPDPSHPGQKP